MIEKTDWHRDPRTWELVQMLVQCRDALPAISLASAKLHNVPLDLDKQIERLIEPWACDRDKPGAI
jgi:hypothetical protein